MSYVLYERAEGGSSTIEQFVMGFGRVDDAQDAEKRYALFTGTRHITEGETPHLALSRDAAEPFGYTASGEPEMPSGGPVPDLPPHIRDRIAELAGTCLDQGFSCVGKVRVNATGSEVTPLDEDVATEHREDGTVMNWMLNPPNDAASVPLRQGFIASIFGHCASLLDYRVDSLRPPAEWRDAKSFVLMDSGSFTLKVESSLSENVIDPHTLEGGGEIRPHHGHKPLLMLLYLQKRWHEEFNTREGGAVELCDEQGRLFVFDRFGSLEPVIERFGFDAEVVRQDAEAIGLVQPRVYFDRIETDVDDCFF